MTRLFFHLKVAFTAALMVCELLVRSPFHNSTSSPPHGSDNQWAVQWEKNITPSCRLGALCVSVLCSGVMRVLHAFRGKRRTSRERASSCSSNTATSETSFGYFFVKGLNIQHCIVCNNVRSPVLMTSNEFDVSNVISTKWNILLCNCMCIIFCASWVNEVWHSEVYKPPATKSL